MSIVNFTKYYFDLIRYVQIDTCMYSKLTSSDVPCMVLFFQANHEEFRRILHSQEARQKKRKEGHGLQIYPTYCESSLLICTCVKTQTIICMYSIFGLKLISLFLQYIEELLRNGQSMEFFLEGGRSRSGKSLSPKAGLLSVIKETLCSGTERLLLYFILVS